MPGIERRREEAARLPFESLFFGVVTVPDLRRAAPFEHVEDLFVHVLLGSDRAGAGDLDHVHALKPAAAVELDECAARAHARPRSQTQLADIVEAHGAAMQRKILLLHVNLIGSCLPYPALGADKIFRHDWVSPLNSPSRCGSANGYIP